MKAALVAAVLLGAASGAEAETGRSCVDVRIGDEQYYDCLNRQLDAAVTGRRVPGLNAPLGVDSPPVALGEYNEAAIRERLGTSYGKSLVPQRPPKPVFTNPLIRR